jgi:hypothetical protein
MASPENGDRLGPAQNQGVDHCKRSPGYNPQSRVSLSQKHPWITIPGGTMIVMMMMMMAGVASRSGQDYST